MLGNGCKRGARRLCGVVLTMACTCSVFGCKGSSEEAAAQGAPSPGVAAVEKKVDKAVADATRQAGGGGLVDPSDKAFSKRACEFLTADMVSGLFGVPAADLKQHKVVGCIYTWRKDGQVLEAKLMLIRVHKTEAVAKTWFQNATATKTKAEINAVLDTAKTKVQERKELNTKLKKKTAADLTEVAKLGTPDEGVTYTDVPGIGDGARVSSADGVIWVRLGNVTFQVSAFKGPDQPKPKIDPKNLKGIAKAAMAAQRQWLKDTHGQRKADALKLAPLVVKAVSAAAG